MSPEQLADGARQSVESPKYGSVTLNRSQVKDCKSFKVVSTGVTTLPAVARRGSDRGHGFVPTWPRRGTHCAFEDRSFAHPTAHAGREAGLAAIVAIHHFLQPTTGSAWGKEAGFELEDVKRFCVTRTSPLLRTCMGILGMKAKRRIPQRMVEFVRGQASEEAENRKQSGRKPTRCYSVTLRDPTQILFSDFLEVQQKIGSSGRTRTYNPPVNSRTYVLVFSYSQQPTCNQRAKRGSVTEPLSNDCKVLHLAEGERV